MPLPRTIAYLKEGSRSMQTRLSYIVVSRVFPPVLFLFLRHVDDGCERSAGVSFKDYDLVFSSTTSGGLKKYDPRNLSLMVGS